MLPGVIGRRVRRHTQRMHRMRRMVGAREDLAEGQG